MVVVKTSTSNAAQQIRQSPIQPQQQQQRLPSFASTQAQKGNASFSSVSYAQGTSPTLSSSSSLPNSPVIQNPQQQPQQSPRIPSFTSPVQQVRHSPAVVQQSPSNSSNPGYFTSPQSSPAVSRNFVSTPPNSVKPQQQQIVLTGYSPTQQQPQQQQYVMSTSQQMPNMSTLEKTAQQQLQMNAQSGAYFSVQKQ